MKYKPIVICTIHGFKSHGKWQTKLSDYFSTKSLPVYSFDYGYRFWGALKPGFKKKLIKKFYDDYTSLINCRKYQIDINDPYRRPSIIAHSLGSYILCNAMLKHQDIRFDKIILCGSIVTKSFEWDLLFRRNQIQFVRNEYSKNDKVVDLSWLLSLNNSGSTGKKGFMESGSFFEEKEFEYFDHGSYFEGNHMNEFWLPFLIKEPPRFQLIVGKDVPSITAFTKYFDQTEMIDVDCYGKDPYWEKYHIPDDLAENWADTNPDIYSFLSKDEKSKEIIGYINAMPLKDEIFHQLLEGTVHDNEIKPSDIVPFNGIKKELNLYIMSIALKPSYQKTHLGLRDLGFEKLFSSLIEKLIEYYKRYQVKINCVAAIGWTEKGIQLCEMFGMKYTGKNELVTNKPIYLLELNNPDNIFIHKSVRKLVMIYNGKGSE